MNARTIPVVATAIALSVVACVAAPLFLETEGALRRQVERVVDRHDAYVSADASLSEDAKQLDLQQSADVRMLISLPEVGAGTLKGALRPVMDRHDAYVYEDASLDELDRSQYLATTAGLREMLEAAAPSGPQE